MRDNVWVVVALLLGVALLFIRRYKQRENTSALRLTGYALIVMSIILVAGVVLGYFDASSHRYGH